MKIRTLVVDDEPLAHEIILRHAQDIGAVEIVGQCYDARQALDFLNRQPVDMMLLDIRMPGLAGTDMLRKLDQQPLTIITSAFSEYALEGFELDVCDYLLKPFSKERLLSAVEKVQKRLGNKAEACLSFREDGAHVRIPIQEIDYLESFGNYVKVRTGSKTSLCPDNLKNMEKHPGMEDFLRIHKSYMIPASKISKIQGNKILVGEHELPIGRSYKSGVLDKVETMG